MVLLISWLNLKGKNNLNLAKLGDGHDESPAVMVGDYNKKLGENRSILKPSWAFVETKN